MTALTLRAVFRLALRQAEGLIGSVIGLLGLTLAVPDHTTLCRRAETLEVPRRRPRRDSEPMHLLMDSTGLKLCGAGEWLLEKHGAKTRRSWRKPAPRRGRRHRADRRGGIDYERLRRRCRGRWLARTGAKPVAFFTADGAVLQGSAEST